MESRNTHVKNMVCWIGMISVSAFCMLAYFIIPFLRAHYAWTNGIWMLSRAGDYLDGGYPMILVTGILALLAFLASIAWLVLSFLRKEIAGILNVCLSGYVVLMYLIAAFYFSISSYFYVSVGVWFMPFIAGAGLFFAIWALVINRKYRCGYLGRCPGFGRDYYTNRGYGGANYGGKYYNGGYGQQAGGYGGQNYGGYGDRTVGGAGYINNNGSSHQRGRSSGRVSVVSGPYSGSAVQAGDGQRITIGRMPGECNLVIADNAVSRVHCYIVFRASSNMYSVMDVSSSGVYDQNRRPIAKNREVMMAPGARLSIGNATVLQLG